MGRTLQIARQEWRRLAVAGTAAVLIVGTVAMQQLNLPSKKVSELVTPAAEVTQPSYFLKLDGIDGESTDRAHPHEIVVDSWSWGDNEPGLQQQGASGAGGGGGAGKVTVHDITISTHVDKASPILMQACANGKHIRTGVLVVRKAGGGQQEYLKIKLTDVMVTSYTLGSTDADGPVVHFSLNFANIEQTYQPQQPDGSLGDPIQAAFDVRNNRAE